MNLQRAVEALWAVTDGFTIMEVCGTHTAAIYKHGIKSLLPPAIRLVSGPGCPVCVTPPSVIDGLVDYAMEKDHTVLSFGDMLRVPGRALSLADAKANGGNVRLMLSPFDVISLAEEQPARMFVLAAVGFETTAPVYAALLERLVARGVCNVKLYTALKTMPEVLESICQNEAVDAFLCPGHVSAVIGSRAYNGLCKRYAKPFVVAGFTPEHIVAAVYAIWRQRECGVPAVQNLYPSVVSEGGQARAQEAMGKYFIKAASHWRGIGDIADSGYQLRPEYAGYCANLPDVGAPETVHPACRCSDVILGRISPEQCPLFLTACTPQTPVGACMVSPEGACGIYGGIG